MRAMDPDVLDKLDFKMEKLLKRMHEQKERTGRGGVFHFSIMEPVAFKIMNLMEHELVRIVPKGRDRRVAVITEKGLDAVDYILAREGVWR